MHVGSHSYEESKVLYVGGIWLIFCVLQFLPIGFTQQNVCYISKSIMKHMQKNGVEIGLALI